MTAGGNGNNNSTPQPADACYSRVAKFGKSCTSQLGPSEDKGAMMALRCELRSINSVHRYHMRTLGDHFSRLSMTNNVSAGVLEDAGP